MDLKGAEEEEKEKGMMIIRPNDLLQLPNPFPDSSQRVIRQKPTRSRYRECLKNHAASVGGNVLDGCGEFMPAGEEGTMDSLKCAACNCHRNFHRRQLDSSVEIGFASMVHPLQLPSPTSNGRQWIVNNVPLMMPTRVKVGYGGMGTESSSEELVNLNSGVDPACFVLSKKRFRTKFTQEQKEKMVEFAEKVGWRIPREDDVEARRFCMETGVKRHVLKVWMHNNKIAKKEEKNE
ncbi:zinc-finger homeodomain protein 6-like [Impatiens glandulifera]|uniref:zinc-finger homeodomain protein 6-like n=1 Tax=Impatiens glandulifera TaxID=253017 RepID=UPI001FB0E7A6|nr:zinc-finger homeodomain protein 6-like [Impatiens glandulifera]